MTLARIPSITSRFVYQSCVSTFCYAPLRLFLISPAYLSWSQIRSAFAMAYSILTNVKTILGLGPNRSILGTIIRPDPVLLKRKGGRHGEVTFNSLLPGAGEPLQQPDQCGDDQEMLCNWQFGDDEPLPRGNNTPENVGTPSSKKKRKTREKSRKKEKESHMSKRRHEDNGSRKEKSSKKKRSRQNGNDANGLWNAGRRSPWSR